MKDFKELKGVLLGFRNAESKDSGRPYTQLFIFNDVYKDKNATEVGGYTADVQYMPEGQVGTVTVNDIGKKVEFHYGAGRYGRPVVERVDFV